MSSVRYVKHHNSRDFPLFNECLVRIRRQRKWIYLALLATTVVATIGVIVVPPDYSATASVMPAVRTSDPSAMGAQFPLAGMLNQTTSPNKLYLELLGSNRVKDAVLAQFGYRRKVDMPPVQPIQIPGYDRDDVLGAVQAASFARKKSEAITITAQSTDPELSKFVANAFVEQLDQRLRQLDIERASYLAEYFDQQLATQRDKVREAEEKLSAYLAKNRNYVVADDPQLKIEVERLGADCDFNRELLLSLMELKANNELESRKSIPRLVVIEYAETPDAGSILGPVKTVVMTTFAVGLFAIGMIVLHVTGQWYIPSATQNELRQSCDALGGDAVSVVNRVRHRFRAPEHSGR